MFECIVPLIISCLKLTNFTTRENERIIFLIFVLLAVRENDHECKSPISPSPVGSWPQGTLSFSLLPSCLSSLLYFCPFTRSMVGSKARTMFNRTNVFCPGPQILATSPPSQTTISIYLLMPFARQRAEKFFFPSSLLPAFLHTFILLPSIHPSLSAAVKVPPRSQDPLAHSSLSWTSNRWKQQHEGKGGKEWKTGGKVWVWWSGNTKRELEV